jgi:hypothetical protein
MSPPLSHEDARQRVCSGCSKKVTDINANRITPQICAWMKIFVHEAFDLNDPRFPCVICTQCKLLLYRLAFPTHGSEYDFPPPPLGSNYKGGFHDQADIVKK